MAIGVLPSQVTGWPPKIDLDRLESDTESASLPLHTPPSPEHVAAGKSHPPRQAWQDVLQVC
jgi:hypothetical protein